MAAVQLTGLEGQKHCLESDLDLHLLSICDVISLGVKDCSCSYPYMQKTCCTCGTEHCLHRFSWSIATLWTSTKIITVFYNSFSTFIQINPLHRQNICCMFNLTTVFVNALYQWLHPAKQEEPQHPNFFGIRVVQLSLRTMTLDTEWLIIKNPTVCLGFLIKEVYCCFSSLPLLQGWTFADTDQSWPNDSGFSCVWRSQL